MNATRRPPTQQRQQSQQQQRQNGQTNGQAKGPFAELKRFPLKAVIWENQTTNGFMFSVQLVRVYRDDKEQWQETHSLNADDLLAAGKLLNDADTLIQDEISERRRQQQSADSKK
jgi:hypothetical protein